MREENPQIKDRVLLKRACRKACEKSLSIIYQKYRKPVCDYLYKAGADEFAEDICQDVFARISENRCNYDGSSDVRDYLFGVAANILRDHQRKKTETTIPPDQIEFMGEMSRMSPVPDAESVVVTEEKLQKLRSNILQLSPKSRQAIEIWLQNGNVLPDQSSYSSDTFRKRLEYAIKVIKKKS